jgi:AsmA protein
VRLALAGSASIPDRELDLKGTAGLVATGKTDAVAFELPFIVQGSWDDPIMLPDPEALIRRSGAAAPLLNARSLLDRLNGARPAAAPVGAIPATEQATTPAGGQKPE